MDFQEFVNEVENSDICPENFREIYNEFQKYQQLAIDTLLEFHRICEKNSIPYQVAFGSLLGAVRDNGQIPWDYDVDVIIPYEEKNRLISALKKDLDERYYFYSPDADKKCRHYIIRLSPKGYSSNLVHIDVFYTIGAPEDADERRAFLGRMHRYNHMRFVKLYKLRDVDKARKLFKCKLIAEKCIYAFVPISYIDKKMYGILEWKPVADSAICVTVQDVYRDLFFESQALWETTIVSTGIGSLRITKNYDQILTRIYKDYHRIFPLKDRLNEMLRSYRKITGKPVKLIDSKYGRYYM